MNKREIKQKHIELKKSKLFCKGFRKNTIYGF